MHADIGLGRKSLTSTRVLGEQSIDVLRRGVTSMISIILLRQPRWKATTCLLEESQPVMTCHRVAAASSG